MAGGAITGAAGAGVAGAVLWAGAGWGVPRRWRWRWAGAACGRPAFGCAAVCTGMGMQYMRLARAQLQKRLTSSALGKSPASDHTQGWPLIVTGT
jgi:hypothetical protein